MRDERAPGQKETAVFHGIGLLFFVLFALDRSGSIFSRGTKDLFEQPLSNGLLCRPNLVPCRP